MSQRSRTSVSVAALRVSAANRSLRRLEAARLASVTGRWAYTVTLAVYAYREAGAGGVAVAGLVRLVPAALAAPLTGVLAARVPVGRLLFRGGILRTAALATAALLVVSGQPAWLAYAAIACESAVSTVMRPVQNAMLPALSRTPEELTSTNLSLSVIESAGLLLGPLTGALLLHDSSVGVVFFAAAAAYLLSTVLLVQLDGGEVPTPPPAQEPSAPLSRLRAIVARPGTSVVIVLYGAQNLVAGALNVLIVVTALRLLDLGQSSVGALTAAVGVGGIVGGGLALSRLRRRRHAADLALGLALWSAPVLALAFTHSEVAAFVLLAIVGVGVTIVDVSAVTLLQRAAQGELLTHALGLLQAVFVTSVGIGTLAAPVLVDAVGARGALLVTGGLLPLLAGALWSRLSRLDAVGEVDPARVELLASIPIFAPLTEQALERLGGQLTQVRAVAGAVVVAQGDPGDAFYIVEHGTVEVEIDGAVVRRLGAAGFFGEIALLRDVPRTATVRAVDDVVLLRLDRGPFLSTVTGNVHSASAARGVIGTRLGAAQPA